jgi:hypothetical protein
VDEVMYCTYVIIFQSNALYNKIRLVMWREGTSHVSRTILLDALQ